MVGLANGHSEEDTKKWPIAKVVCVCVHGDREMVGGEEMGGEGMGGEGMGGEGRRCEIRIN